MRPVDNDLKWIDHIIETECPDSHRHQAFMVYIGAMHDFRPDAKVGEEEAYMLRYQNAFKVLKEYVAEVKKEVELQSHFLEQPEAEQHHPYFTE